MKNQTYIISKKEKLVDEIVSIRRDFRKTKNGQILCLGLSDEKTALGIKFYQLSILKKIQDKPESTLKKWLTLSRKKVCKDCKKGLKKGDLHCQKDFRVMILADMIRRSVQ